MTFDTWTIVDRVHRMSLIATLLAARASDFIDRIFHREPTLLVELGTCFSITVWAVCLFVPGPLQISPVVDENIHRIPEAAQASLAALVATNQAIAVWSGISRWRAWASFAAAIWLGWLSGAILAADPRLPGGYIYLGMAAVSLLPFWRIYVDEEGTIN